MPQLDSKRVRPWIRLFARTTDYWIAGLIIGVIHGIITPQDYKFTLPYLFLLLLPLIFVESGLLSTWGTTPGKWLFGIAIRDSVGKKLTFLNALKRSFWVWSIGLGFCFPILCPITLIISYYKLRKNGTTWWDHRGGYAVLHTTLGFLGVVFTGLLILVYFTLVLLPFIELTTRMNINEQVEKVANYLDEHPILTEVKGPPYRVLIGGNIIRSVYFRYPPIYATTIFFPHATGGIRAGIEFILIFRR